MANYIAENLKFLRLKKPVSQEQLSLQVKKASTTISNWEKKVSTPNFEEIEVIANYFEVTPGDFIYRDLSKGKLIPKERAPKNDEKGKVIGKPIGKVNDKNEVNYGQIEEKEPWIIEERKTQPQPPVLMPRVVTIDIRGEENAVFVPVRARAGYLQGYGDEKFLEKLPAYKIIGDRNKTYRIFEVDGNSMFPTLNDKDTVNAYWVSLSDIRDERIHVLVTRTEGIIIKRVINRYKEGILVCKSDNSNRRGEFAPIILNVHDILEVWYVDSSTTRNLSQPGEIYDRISNLEADLAIIKHRLKDD